MKNFAAEFKAFAIKGNVVDLAVAVVIGTAFGKIVSSLVANIITPAIGLLMGGIDFSGLSYEVDNASISYGVFVQSIIDFLIISLVIFIVVKSINKAQALGKKDVPPAEAPVAKPSEEVQLLREIRDGLRR